MIDRVVLSAKYEQISSYQLKRLDLGQKLSILHLLGRFGFSNWLREFSNNQLNKESILSAKFAYEKQVLDEMQDRPSFL